MMKISKLGVLILAAAAAVSVTGCDLFGKKSEAPAQQAQQLLPVGCIAAITADVPDVSTITGRTSAYKESEVRPQVSGIIQKRMFTEGSFVKKGTQLYQIDPRTYEAAVDSAKAALAQAEANEYSAKARAERYKKLIDSKAISEQDLDDAVAAEKAAAAQVLSAKATLKNAKINLEYTRVYAPISGIIGKSSVTEGALVTANQGSALATIQQIDPIYVDLGQSDVDLRNFKQAVKAGKIKLDSKNRAAIQIYFEDGKLYPVTGHLDFTGVDVNKSTGMVTVRATVDNKDGLLLPGMFMRARLVQGELDNAVLIPQVAAIRGNRGEVSVYRIEEGNKYYSVPITLGREYGNAYVVTSGLKAGDLVAIDNIQKLQLFLQPGTPVNPEKQEFKIDFTGTDDDPALLNAAAADGTKAGSEKASK